MAYGQKNMNKSLLAAFAEPSGHETVQRLRVELGERGYDIVVGRGLIADAAYYVAPLLNQQRTIIVTDETVEALWLASLADSLGNAGIDVTSCVLPAGESTKNFQQLEKLCGEILRWRPERGSTVIALGGGVIGDLTGFASAIVMRGLRFIQVPTTVLAQVDSSVGGKTGINTAHGKNLVGAFHQPGLVLIDTATIDTLPSREMTAGYAEIAKYGLLGNADLFRWLEINGADFFAGAERVRQHLVIESCRMKAQIVAKDEKEGDVRALLNLGHTFGHVLETEIGYDGRLLHGEAVGIGIILAFRLSALLGHCDERVATRIVAHFQAVGVPYDLGRLDTSGWTAGRLFNHMRLDKKVRDGRLTFVLARDIGDSFISRDVPESAVLSVLETALEASTGS